MHGDFSDVICLVQILFVPLALFIGTIVSLIGVGKALKEPSGFRLSVRGMMVAVAVVGIGLGTALWWIRFNFATVYAPGFDEIQFQRVRVGMTQTDVESILGAPLRKEYSQRWNHYENWVYSDPPGHASLGDNYWRRWVMFNQGRVASIVDDYYED